MIKLHYKKFHTQSRLQKLTWEMIRVDQKPPKLRAKSAETRHLVPCCYELAMDFHKQQRSAHSLTVRRLFEQLFSLSPALALMIGCEKELGKKKQKKTGHRADTSAPRTAWHQYQMILTVSQVGPTPMFSRSCAGHTISTSGHQWSFWPGDRWRHVFGSRLHFYALSAIRIRRPSCCNVRAFPECSNARVGTHEMHDLQTFNLSSLPLLTCGARMPIGRPCWSQTPDFTSMSLNIFHASKTVCKRAVANVFILFGKT